MESPTASTSTHALLSAPLEKAPGCPTGARKSQELNPHAEKQLPGAPDHWAVLLPRGLPPPLKGAPLRRVLSRRMAELPQQRE